MNRRLSWKLFPAVLLLLLSAPFLWAHGNKHKKQADEQLKAAHWAAPTEEKERKNPVAMSDASVLRGKAIYLQDCAGCHGAMGDGKGPDADGMEPPPTNLAAMAGHHMDGDLAWKIRKGNGPMPAWEELFSEDEIWDLVNYIQSLKK